MTCTLRPLADTRSMSTTSVSTNMQLNKLSAFRQAAYECLRSARDALFEVSDALMFSPYAPSFAHLSLAPGFRRAWPSLYEAVQDGHIDRQALLRLYCTHVHLTPTSLQTPAIILAGDHTAWTHPTAKTLADRTYQYQPTQTPGARPVAVGHGYSTLAWIPEAQGSWALPLLHERIPSHEDALQRAATQVRQVRAALPASQRIVALYDSQYGCVPFLAATADVEVITLVRLRPNLRLYQVPPPYAGRGRRPTHGPPFKLKDPATWGQPAETLTVVEPDGTTVLVQRWANLHFRALLTRPFSVLRVKRTMPSDPQRDPKPQWLAWVDPSGAAPPPLTEWWALYGRRFALDHWYRLAKGRLGWTTPRFGTPEQGERWSDLLPLVTWELWLARPYVTDHRLPWQPPQTTTTMTPGRVCASIAGIVATIGTPASAPKPRGNAPGWPKGTVRRRRTRCAVIKKGKAGRPRAA
jgi:hypothetical protein